MIKYFQSFQFETPLKHFCIYLTVYSFWKSVTCNIFVTIFKVTSIQKCVLVKMFLCSVMSQSIPTGYIPPGISSKSLPGGSGFDFRKLPGGRQFDKGRDYVENEIETSKK